MSETIQIIHLPSKLDKNSGEPYKCSKFSIDISYTFVIIPRNSDSFDRERV